MKKLFLLLLGSIFTLPALADCVAVSCEEVTIDSLYINEDSNIEVSTSGNEANLKVCDGTVKFLTLVNNTVGFDQRYSILLMAHATEKPLSLEVVPATDDRCLITGIRSEVVTEE